MSAADNWNQPGWKRATNEYHSTVASSGLVLLKLKAETSELTEDALALRFSERHADDLRYIATKGAWLKWDGARWYPEATHLAFDLARQSCRADAQAFGNGKPPTNEARRQSPRSNAWRKQIGARPARLSSSMRAILPLTPRRD
jgi:phage/plasmid-associated DNA primase